MEKMFNGALAFNQNIGSCQTTKVKNMSEMFRNASSFNQDITSWNVPLVTTMTYMFSGASKFSQNLKTWNPKTIINKNDVDALGRMFDNSGVSCSVVKDIKKAWGLSFNSGFMKSGCSDL